MKKPKVLAKTGKAELRSRITAQFIIIQVKVVLPRLGLILLSKGTE